jgi:uncharacterized DUF497 family protein
VDIVWDEKKNTLLKETRGVSFEEVDAILKRHGEIAQMDNPAREGQVYFIVNLHDYVHVVPAVISDDGIIALKTIFPSRKYNKLFGGKHD